MKESIFLTAEWRKLAIANYAIDPALLKPFLPAFTELDMFNGKCYVSLVGFMFLDTKVKGMAIPFHRNFEEVNLRFYVRYREGQDWRRGVVFVKEIVPKAAITFVANTIYKEHYQTMPMKHEWKSDADSFRVSYQWKLNQWHSISMTTHLKSVPIAVGSEEEFITEHYWGYTTINDSATSEYEVRHPRWDVYPVQQFSIDADFGALYGQTFNFLTKQKPDSVFLAEGSPIHVMGGRKIK